MNLNIITIGVILLWVSTNIYADKPCAPREYFNRSVVCICNATYCDTIRRVTPLKRTFVSYTTSEAGSRFRKSVGQLESDDYSDVDVAFELNPMKAYQTIEGFGTAITESSAVLLRNLSRPAQRKMIETYFGSSGLELNMLRVPIGVTDFSFRNYSYVDENDKQLKSFALTSEDLHYKIPMIKEIRKAACAPIKITITSWTPPAWMKYFPDQSICGRLKEEYYESYADYHYKFVEHYARHGINVWAVSTTNEPTMGLSQKFPHPICIGWTPVKMGKWIANNFGPKFRNSKFRNIKILGVEDMRYTVPIWFDGMIDYVPEALDYLDGISLHGYYDTAVPPEMLSPITEYFPDKFMISTELSILNHNFPEEQHNDPVDFGSWHRAVIYITNILQNLKSNVVGWIDWNFCLDKKGGPSLLDGALDSPVIVFPEDDEFVKQPMFYGIGHFSKFIPRGSLRIDVQKYGSPDVKNIAFLTPRETVVVILYNGGAETKAGVQLGQFQAVVDLEANSVTTVELPNIPTISYVDASDLQEYLQHA